MHIFIQITSNLDVVMEYSDLMMLIGNIERIYKKFTSEPGAFN